MATIKNTGARYEILVNGVVRSHRSLTIALAAAEYLRTMPGNTVVQVRDSETGAFMTHANKAPNHDDPPQLKR
jgi:hypothetical protein